jgi:hypothetical protein
MNFKIDYYIRRKSDHKLMEIRHIELDEQVLIDAAKEYFTVPIRFEGDDYEFSDIEIVEVNGLR